MRTRQSSQPATHFHSSKPWAKIVPSGSDDDAVIVAVDESGTVTDIERPAFGDAAAADVTKTLTHRP